MTNLQALRSNKSRQQIATAIGIPLTTYTHYELGERQVPNEILFKLADYYGVSIDYLLGRETSISDTNQTNEGTDPSNKTAQFEQTGQVRNLRSLREASKKQQNEIAQAIGITKQAYSHYETGRREPDYQTLIKLAEYFGVSVDYILGRETKEAPPMAGQVLTEREQELIDIYRACPPGQQGQIFGYAQALLDERKRQERRQA